MKTSKILYTSILATSLFLSGCSASFLDVEPMTDVLENNFYKTIDDVEMALIGCYDGYQRTSSNGNLSFTVASEILSDNCFGGTGHTDGRGYQVLDRFDKAQSPSDNNLFDGTWTDYYAGIFRCNTLLTKMEETDFGDQQSIQLRIEGETRFLRAIMYFDLVRLFGRVPLLTSPTSDNVPQVEPKETYQLIVEDLKFAADNIPADAYPKSNAANNDGRVTPHAAKALLARVYLFYTGYYGVDDLPVSKAEVVAGLEEIVASNEFALLVDFKSLWPAASYVPVPGDNTLDRSGYAGKGNLEVVFAKKFNNTQNYNGNIDGNRWLVMLGLRNTNFSPYGQGWGACTVNPRLVNAFSDNDARKVASIIDIEGEGIAGFDINDQREYTGYANKKYTPTSLPDGSSNTGGDNDFQISQDQDYFVIRYADVLLMAAELGSSQAQNYFNLVRQRAYGSSFVALPVNQTNILQERRLEFAFEGIRYWDLLRQGVERAAATIAQTQNVLSGSAPDQVIINEQQVISTKGLMQIPNNQITLSNGVLTQNDGWN
ncbi:RagB/SusD family nutrient uptake outer membrane protein [Sphingobacterium corticibacterium]|uniref:RagB/SusD family nutrient uptake outer membrane protein n=1 Tax=Sphingobacterium corticibacterium TaxID=2484746 RepID=A0A4Q6XHP8_9SPHI|nr:RagB/SusD family nutrient uptake outer membrane protein [Sphingobacterium corticibacterium]RZF58675.1 RagB/SusD family nutrient uptake outer membrane protein [Sphingobacterium corticibacterium]